MKYCSHCGKEVHDDAVVCIHCGCSLTGQPTAAVPGDAPNTGFAVLGFFFPIVGLILYLINKEKFPQKAKSAGKGALIGFGIGILSSIFFAIVDGVVLSGLL